MDQSLLEELASKAVAAGGIKPKERRTFLIEARKLIKESRTTGQKITNPKVQALGDILDQIDKQMEGVSEKVDDEFACPGCGERWQDQLIFMDDNRVKCYTCGIIYHPLPDE